MTQLITGRLSLRPVSDEDEPGVQALAGGDAAGWIARHQQGWEAGTSYAFAVYTQQPRAFVGVVVLVVTPPAGRAELGYAIAPEAQGRGYATEACGAVLRFAFEHLGLQRVSAACLAGNRASSRVLDKLGFRLEAILEPEEPRVGTGVSMLFYGMMREDYEAARADTERPLPG